MNNEKKFIKLTPFKMQVLQTFPFIDADFDAITNYELLCKVVEYLDTTVDNVNLLESDFKVLYDYVHDYFDNLDVQEEINNKLDQMVTDGTLPEIIASYLNSKAVFCFDTIESMKQSTNLINGSYAKTLGYHTKNDGGESTFKITDNLNTKFNIKLNNGLYAELITNNKISIKQLGAIGDGTLHTLNEYYNNLEDAQETYPLCTSLNESIDEIAIITAINKYWNCLIYIPYGTFCVTKTIDVNIRSHITGVNKQDSIIKFIGDVENNTYIFNLLQDRNIIENLAFLGNNTINDHDYAENKISGINSSNHTLQLFKNLRFMFLNNGIHFNNSWCNSVNDSYFARCNKAIDCREASNSNSLSFINDVVEYCNYGFSLGQGRNQSMYNCTIEHITNHGIDKFNEGDIEVHNCYFEYANINIEWGNTYVSSALISGCSFFQNPSTPEDSYIPILYHGSPTNTKITIMNCNFKNISSNPALQNIPIIGLSDTGSALKSILINNSIYQMSIPYQLVNLNIDNKGYNNYTNSLGKNNLNLTNEKTVNLNEGLEFYYRINLPTDGTSNIVLPTITDLYSNHIYNFVVVGNNANATSNHICTITSPGYIYGSDKTISKNDVNKIIKVIYLGNFDSRDNWLVVK